MDKMQLQREIPLSFMQWADTYFKANKNCYLPLFDTLKDFREQTGFKSWNTPIFIKVLEKWCCLRDLKLNPMQTLDRGGTCRDELAENRKECIFIVEKENDDERQLYKIYKD